MIQKTDACTCSYGAGVLLKQAQAMKAELPGVQAGTDIEHIHRMRVASRRFRNALPIFSSCLPEKTFLSWTEQIKQITRSLGVARDTDVQIDHLVDFERKVPELRYKIGIRRLILRLSQKRQKLQAGVDQVIKSLAENNTLEGMINELGKNHDAESYSMFSPILYHLGKDTILARLDDFFTYEQEIHQPERILELHATRIAVKHLRYTLESFAPIYPGNLKSELMICRNIQENLGAIHDCDVWLAYLPKFIESERRKTIKYYGRQEPLMPIIPGIHYFEQNRQSDRDILYRSFIKHWREWKTRGVWAKLVGTIEQGGTQSNQPAGLTNDPCC